MTQTNKKTVQKKPLNPKDVKKLKIFVISITAANVICILLMSIFWSPLEWPIILGVGFLASIPAFIANAGMTFAGTIRGIGTPMDFGKNFIDGRRILGEGKTWKGFLGGILIGSTISWLLVLLYAPIATAAYYGGDWAALGKVTYEELRLFLNPSFPNLFFRTILLSVGACTGDAIGSFFKRRLNISRGQQFPMVDQIDFILIAYLFAYAFFPIPWYYILVISIFTPLVVVLANIVAYYIGRKSVPW